MEDSLPFRGDLLFLFVIRHRHAADCDAAVQAHALTLTCRERRSSAWQQFWIRFNQDFRRAMQDVRNATRRSTPCGRVDRLCASDAIPPRGKSSSLSLAPKRCVFLPIFQIRLCLNQAQVRWSESLPLSPLCRSATYSPICRSESACSSFPSSTP